MPRWRGCKAAGIGTALDDFGSGHPSASCLHPFALQRLEIERPFVVALGSRGRPRQTTIVAAILALRRHPPDTQIQATEKPRP